MDNLVLIRVVAELDRALRHAILREARGEGAHRHRFLFEREGRWSSIVVSLRPELPWIGRPAGKRKSGGKRADRFVAIVGKALGGAVLESIEKPSPDRVVVLRFAGGPSLTAELATHGANLVLVGDGGEVVASARRPRAAQKRIVPGEPYVPPSIPKRLFIPFGADAEAIDAVLDDLVRGGETPFEALRRHLFGIGTEGARLVVDEARETGRSAGRVLAARLRALSAGELNPALVAPGDPLAIALAGRLEEEGVRLLPWRPASGATAGLPVWERDDPAATAGLYHEAVEADAEVAGRGDALLAILRREVRKLWEVETKIGGDVRSFEDPERYRKWGEAILAGLSVARRIGESVQVPDPYDPEEDLVIPAPRDLKLPAVAEAHFGRHRRARRGLEAALARAAKVRARRERLDRLLAESEGARGEAAADRLESAMRAERIPVGLARRTGGPKRSAPAAPVREEGVRMYTSSDGFLVLVGRTGPANDRLTFKIASPDDFWLHVRGHPGAHVVVRNPQRLTRLPASTLEEAAGLAAWHSGARDEQGVEVQWTRRKNVRRAKGAPRGTVLVKRSETVRVRPSRLDGGDGA